MQFIEHMCYYKRIEHMNDTGAPVRTGGSAGQPERQDFIMIGITGVALMAFTAVLYRKYRPKSQDSRMLCGLAAAMGLMALVSGPASWPVQLIQCILQVVVGYCCFAQLRRERILRTRRRALHLRRAPHNKIKTCA